MVGLLVEQKKKVCTTEKEYTSTKFNM